VLAAPSGGSGVTRSSLGGDIPANIRNKTLMGTPACCIVQIKFVSHYFLILKITLILTVGLNREQITRFI
jgi:hypothetical protein